MKRVLILSLNYYPRFIGGAEVAIKEITDRIGSSDIEFHMVTLRFDASLPKVERVGNVLVHRIGFAKKYPDIADLKRFPLHLNKILFQFLATCEALHLHKKYHYDCIWAMMAHSAGVPAALFKMWNPQVPYLLTLQEGDPIDHIKRTMRFVYPIFARAFTRADIVQVISTFLGRWARDMGFVGPLEVVPNAVDTKHFSDEYTVEQLFALKQKLGKSSDDIFLITTSRLVAKNAVDDIIRALKLLPKEIKFLVLGIGPDETMLRSLARDSGVEDRVKFLGQISHNEMPVYLKVSDIFIRPSLSEGMGNSFIEAMAAGVPIIATQEGGISDFLFDPEKNPECEPTGLAVPVRDPEAIARQVKRLVEDQALRAYIVAIRILFFHID
ncbi:MAG: Glycosyltransferase [Candidatus Nomurabacteria bacterium GW2011_GWA2_42_41]|nr:MAG: Glycosyltransferase [Candidatus Nomurabacteria bacterium GW2011_GWA2_42_41]